MSEARDRKMKRKRKFDEMKAEKVLRACRSRRYIENADRCAISFTEYILYFIVLKKYSRNACLLAGQMIPGLIAEIKKPLFGKSG